MNEIESSLRETRRGYDIERPTIPSGGRLREVPVVDILLASAETVRQERGRLNGLSSFQNDGAYGDRMAQALADAATAVYRTGNGGVADELEIAGQVLLDSMYTPAANAIGRGLIAASEHYQGRSGLSVADLQPILAGLVQGAQDAGMNQTGQGTALDVFSPALAAYEAAATRNLTPGQTAQGVLGAATVGMRSTARMTGPNRKPNGREDLGAAAAQAALTGMLKGLMGRVPPTPPGQSTDNFLLGLLNQGVDLFDLLAPEGENSVETTLSLSRLAGRYDESSEGGTKARV